MNSLFYLAMLVGVGWLAVWTILPEGQRGKGWWPFDMREPAPETAEATPARRGEAARDARGRSPATASSPGTLPPGPVTPATGKTGEAVSWRTRSARALASRHRA